MPEVFDQSVEEAPLYTPIRTGRDQSGEVATSVCFTSRRACLPIHHQLGNIQPVMRATSVLETTRPIAIQAALWYCSAALKLSGAASVPP